MDNKKISDLDEDKAVTLGDYVPIVTPGLPQTRKASLARILGLGGGGGTGSAEAVFLDSFVVNLPNNQTGIANGTQVNAGDPIAPFIEAAFKKSKPVTYTLPYALISSIPGGGTFEVAQKLSIQLSLQYFANDGGGSAGFNIYKNGAILASASNAADTIGPLTPQTINYTGTINFLEGSVKADDFGNPVSAGHITEGVTPLSNTIAYNFVYPWFWGVQSTAAQPIVYSNHKVVNNASGQLNINFNALNQYIWFAHDATLSDKTTWYITALNNGSIGGTASLFATPVIITVNGNGWVQSYKLYMSNFATTTSSNMIIS